MSMLSIPGARNFCVSVVCHTYDRRRICCLLYTSVEKVSLNRGTDHEELLGEISAEDARKYMEADQFEKGSMLPKIEAGISFIEKGAHRRAIITDMAHAQDGYKEKTGTIIK